VKGKYGHGVIGKMVLGENYLPWFASSWWRDICSIGVNLGRNWFAQGVVRKMGNGVHTMFWEDTWVGPSSLRK
jgi:hypothetical protein